MGKVCYILGCGKDFLHTWLQQILHNGRCVNILKRHMSSANLMKTFVNPNVNVFSLTLSRKKKKIPLSISLPPPPPPPPTITTTLLFDEENDFVLSPIAFLFGLSPMKLATFATKLTA